MQEGKLPWELLKELVLKSGAAEKSVIQGPKAGCDVAVFDYHLAIERTKNFYESNEEVYVVYKTDPITFPTPNPGKYAVVVNSNDIVTSGALPYAFNSTIILPVGTTKEQVIAIQENIHSECKKQQITVLGGHTEFSSSVNTPIISGAMIGFVPRDYYVPRQINEGDAMLCVGWCTKEGMGIIASEGYEKLRDSFGEQNLNLLIKLGENISVAESALSINKKFKPGLMHDATEGGILGAAYETIAVEDFGLELIEESFPVTRETKEICELLDVNPLQVISSGTLLVVTSPQKAEKILKESTKEVPIKIVGKIVSKKKGITLDGKPLPPPQSDAVIDALKKIEEGSF